MKIEVSREELLMLARQWGYTIDVDIINDSKVVTFNSSNSNSPGYTLPRGYSTTFTEYEIKLDCINELLDWAGLRPKVVLDY